MSEEVIPDQIEVQIDKLGGIDSANLTVERGVTILTGENATNRTSILSAIAGVLGGSATTLKSDADEGFVEMVIDDDRYTRRYHRTADGVRTDGNPFTEDEPVVDVFSCLLESNPARRAIEQGEGEQIREALMRPVDTAQLEADIRDQKAELRTIEDRLEEITAEKQRLPALEDRRQTLISEREDLDSALDAARETIDTHEADLEDAEEAEGVVQELQETRNELEDVRQRLETQRHAVEALEAEFEEIVEKLANIPESDLDRDALEDKIEQTQRTERRLENTINNLVSIIEFNEALLDGERLEQSIVRGVDSDVTEDLDPMSQSIDCWTCGSVVERSDIEDRLVTLRELVEEKRVERREIRSHLETLQDDLESAREQSDREESLTTRRRSVEAELEDRRSTIDTLEARQSTLTDQVAELEAEAEDTDALRGTDLLEQYREVSDLEFNRGQLEEKLRSVEADIQAIEATIDEEDDLRSQRDEAKTELERLRTRIEDLERSLVESFNDHMATVLDSLGYDNIERVWIERKSTGDEQRGGVSNGTFHLHIVRETEDGSVYEDTVETLSESEKEVIGLVVPLAGFLVHDVYERVPIMLLDSLEAIDASRIATLIEYFSGYVPYLIVALLPEDADEVGDDNHRLRMDDSQVIA